MTAELISLEDSNAIATIARAVGVTFSQARTILLGVVSLPQEQADRIMTTMRVDAARRQSRRDPK